MRIAKKKLSHYPIIPLVFYFRNGRRTAQTAIHNDMIFNLRMNVQLPLIFAKWLNQFAKPVCKN